MQRGDVEVLGGAIEVDVAATVGIGMAGGFVGLLEHATELLRRGVWARQRHAAEEEG